MTKLPEASDLACMTILLVQLMLSSSSSTAYTVLYSRAFEEFHRNE